MCVVTDQAGDEEVVYDEEAMYAPVAETGGPPVSPGKIQCSARFHALEADTVCIPCRLNLLYTVIHTKRDILFLSITFDNLNRLFFYSFYIILIVKKFYM